MAQSMEKRVSVSEILSIVRVPPEPSYYDELRISSKYSTNKVVSVFTFYYFP